MEENKAILTIVLFFISGFAAHSQLYWTRRNESPYYPGKRIIGIGEYFFLVHTDPSIACPLRFFCASLRDDKTFQFCFRPETMVDNPFIPKIILIYRRTKSTTA